MPAPVDVRLDALNKAAEEWFAGPGRPRPGRIAVYSGVVLFVSIAVLVLWRLDQLDWVSPPALVPTVGISGILAVPFILCFWWLSKAPVDKLGLHKKNGPSFAARRTGRRQAVTAALALAVVLLLGGVWFGRAAMLYLTNQGELELVPQDGLASLIVLKNDEGVIDENKLNPMVTDWLGMKTSHILKLPPGKYQLNAGTRSPGPRIIYWEVTTSGPRGSNHLLVPGEGAMGWTVMVTVERGERVRVRPVLANESSTSPSLPEVRWVELFNSKDLTGWRIPPEQPGNWKVENGELVGRSPAASYLFTEVGAYEDFRFRAEVKINRTGNAGVFVRAPLEGFKFDSPAGYEADLTFVAGRPNSPLGSLWKQEKRLQKALDSEPGPDQWFLLEVIATGPRLQVLVNHKLVTDYTDPAPSARKGHIVLQAIDEGTEVRFRRIEIEEFPPKTIEVKP